MRFIPNVPFIFYCSYALCAMRCSCGCLTPHAEEQLVRKRTTRHAAAMRRVQHRGMVAQDGAAALLQTQWTAVLHLALAALKGPRATCTHTGSGWELVVTCVPKTNISS
jgi:hypothetical protein